MGRQMRYARGVPLTQQERQGGGMGAGRSYAQGNMYGGGGNPNVPEGAFGGAGDASGSDRELQRLFTGGGENRTGDLLRQLMEYWRSPEYQESARAQQIRPEEAYMAERKGKIGPVRAAQEAYQARQATDPWGPGGQFEGRRAADLLSPEAIMASQGNTAANQWAQRGGAPGIDQAELERFNRMIAAQRGNRSYV